MADETSSSERKAKIPIARLKAISKCANCGERGHWYRECPKPPCARSLEPSSFTHLASILHTSCSEGRGWGCQQPRRARGIREPQFSRSSPSAMLWLTRVRPLQQKRRESGLKAVILPHAPRTAKGVGSIRSLFCSCVSQLCVH